MCSASHQLNPNQMSNGRLRKALKQYSPQFLPFSAPLFLIPDFPFPRTTLYSVTLQASTEVTYSTLSNVLIYTYGCAERLMIMMIIIKHFHIFKPHSWELQMQKLKSHLVRTQSLNILPCKPGVGQYIAMHAQLLPGSSSLLISTLPVHSPAFSPKPLPVFSCVGCG